MLCLWWRLRRFLYIRMSARKHKTRRRLACLRALQASRQSFCRCDQRLCFLRLHGLRLGSHLLGAADDLEIVEGKVLRIVEGRRDLIFHAQPFAGDKMVCGSWSPLSWSC